MREWTKFGSVADNNGTRFRTEADSPFPGVNSVGGFKDASTPWLDTCEPGDTGNSAPRCWFSVVSSGGHPDATSPSPPMSSACFHSGMTPPCAPNISAVGILIKTRNELDLTRWEFVRLFHPHAPVHDRNGYSCVDFFRVAEDRWAFGSYYSMGSTDDAQYSVGTFKNHAFTPIGSGRMPPGEIWKTGGVGVDATAALRRHVYVGTTHLSESLSRNGVSHRGYVATLPKDIFLDPTTNSTLGFAFVPELQRLRRPSPRMPAAGVVVPTRRGGA